MASSTRKSLQNLGTTNRIMTTRNAQVTASMARIVAIPMSISMKGRTVLLSGRQCASTMINMNPIVRVERLDMKKYLKSKEDVKPDIKDIPTAAKETLVESEETSMIAGPAPPVTAREARPKNRFCNICGAQVSSIDELHGFYELNEKTLKRFVCLTCHQRCAPTERPRHKAGCYLLRDDVYYDGWENDGGKIEKFRMLACQKCVDAAKETGP